jgi:monoamine oxidase
VADSFDIVIIGAGAAGIAAGRVLANAHASFLVLEARDRIGGRAFTVEREGFGVDLGCGWLHAARRNVWRAEAEQHGFAIDHSSAPWEKRQRAEPSEERARFGAAFAKFHERIDAAAAQPDRPASDYLEPGDPSNERINAVCTYLNGVTLDRVSAHDYIRYDGEGGNQRLTAGYGALIAALGAKLPIALNTNATVIDHSGARVRIETNRGAMDARAVIVATPTPLIAEEALRFSPALPTIVEAAAGLPLGVVDKMFVGFAEADMPAGTDNALGQSGLMRPSYDLRPMGRPMIEAFIAGPLAEALEREGQNGMEAFVLDDLVRQLGGAMRTKLTPLAASAWAHDEWARGSYSYAKPGMAPARDVLAEPATERLFIAGEASAGDFFGTAHGAAETGILAANRALAALAATTRG